MLPVTRSIKLLGLAALALLAARSTAQAQHNTLTPAEQSAGWRLLFDGQSLKGWTWSTAPDPNPPSWAAIDGELRTTPGRGEQVYLLTTGSFTDFELTFEWKAEPGANSGIKYRFQGYWVNGKPQPEPSGPTRIEPIALEYQIIDDQAHPDAVSDPKHATAAIYEYWAATLNGPTRMDVWHTSRIIARGLHLEHWLDGKRVISLDLDTPEAQLAFASSKRRGSSPVLARHERRRSPIALQFHDGAVAFRNLKLRPL